jgi:Uma2 family endonuclease
MTVLARHASIADLIRLQDRTHRYELVHGELRQLSSHCRQRATLSAITSHLGAHVWNHGLGVLYLPGTSFAIGPDTVRSADGAFVAADRLAEMAGGDYFAHGAPDLVIEIADAYGSDEVIERVNDWLSAGTRMVVVVDGADREIVVHRELGQPSRLTRDDAIHGADVVPGWSLMVSEIFAR